MEKEVIKKYYNQYLQEVFETDTNLTDYITFSLANSTTNNTTFLTSTGKKFIYDYVLDFQDGYAVVKKGNKYNYIDKDGNLLSEKWFDDAYSFNEGLAAVVFDKKFNFINRKGEYLFENSPRLGIFLGNIQFENGVAVLSTYDDEDNYYYFYVDKDGHFLCSETFTRANEFVDGYSLAQQGDNYFIVDLQGNVTELPNENVEYYLQIGKGRLRATNKYLDSYITDLKGNRIGNEILGNCFNFKNGIAKVLKNEKVNYINKDGKLISETWFDNGYDFHDDFALVIKNGEYNFLDKNGKLLLKESVQYASGFHNHLSVIRIGDQYTYCNKKGKISNLRYDYLSSFNNGYAIATKDNKKNFITPNGKTISTIWFEDAYPFNNGYALIKKDGQYNYIDEKGNIKLNEWYEYGFDFQYGVGVLYKNNTLYFLDDNLGQLFTFEQHLNLSNHISLKRSVALPDIELIQSKKRWFKYTYQKDNQTHKLDMKPLYEYEDLIICEKDSQVYYYDKTTTTYTHLCAKKDLILEKNYIIVNDKKYYIHNNDLIDISTFKFRYSIEKTDGVTRILTLDEFTEVCMKDKYKEVITAEVQAQKARKAKIEEEKFQKQLLIEQEKEQQRIKEAETKLNTTLQSISSLLEESLKYIKVLEYNDMNNISEKISVPKELLFIQVEDHLEINPTFNNPRILKHIDYMFISFDNVKVSGLDLSYTNANIDPQKVYKKDLSNGKFCKLDFNLKDFSGVNIDNADFTEAILDFAKNFNQNKKLGR